MSVGIKVQGIADTPVRSKATTNPSGKIQCTQPSCGLGVIASGPQTGSGYSWWNVNFDTGCDGWTTQEHIRLIGVDAGLAPDAPG